MLDAARAAAATPAAAAVVDDVLARLAAESRRGLTGVLNGTGILLHTNLGRAPLAREALDALADVAGGASNLEYDLDAGARGSRYDRLGALLRAATGAEDALVVNNCAAAVLLVLDTFARAPDGSAREVIVARNQLVEIGGGFRLPDVLARSGATLVEVGATNKVRLEDYARALTPRTALLLRAHASNYRIEGFTAEVGGAELAALGARAGVPVVEDLGSGALIDLRAYGLPHERTVQEAVADGIDLIAFSGDKLLGGPQAGIIVGTRRVREALAREPAAARAARRAARRSRRSARRCGCTSTRPRASGSRSTACWRRRSTSCARAPKRCALRSARSTCASSAAKATPAAERCRSRRSRRSRWHGVPRAAASTPRRRGCGAAHRPSSRASKTSAC